MATKAFALFICMLAFGCMLEGSVIGSGKEARETREVANFTQLEFLGAGRIDVSPVVSLHVTITGAGTVTYSGEPKITQKITRGWQT